MGECETENKLSWLDSDGFLGAMVVLLTIVTAFAAYQSALTSIKGDDLDFAAQKTLVLATASFQSGNSELLEDMYTYDGYRQFADQDLDEAAVAWASLVGTGRRIRLIFLLVAMASLMAGFVVIIRVVFES